jgi:hypothetical protein
VTSGHGQNHSILREFPMRQVLVPGCETSGKPSIQSAGQDGFNLMNRKLVMQLQRRIRVPPPEFAKGVYNHSMPGYCSGNPDSKRTVFAMGNPFGAKLRLIDVLQDTSRIGQEQFPRLAQSNSARQSVEQGESKFSFQILNLAR